MTSDVSIVHCDLRHRSAWNAYVAASPHASFFHRFEWREINEASFGHRTAWLAAMVGGRIAGIFPLVHVRSRLFGSIACSMPFVNYGGPCADTPESERALIAEARRVIDDWGVKYLEIRSRRDLGPMFVTSQHKVSLRVGLASDPDVLWKAFKTGHRQDIRRGYRAGIVVRFGGRELLDDFYRALSESWRDLGTPIYSKEYLRRIVEALGSDIRICVVYAGEEPAAAAFDGLHGDAVEGMWLAVRAKFRSRLVGYVLYWELIKHACEAGFKQFHLGRSTVQSGGETFKKKWNADSSQLFWHYVLRTSGGLPQLNVENPKYRLAINAWRKLPVPVTQVIGPLFARSIP